METVCEWPVLVQACKVGASRKHGSDCDDQANLFAKQIRRRYAGQTNRRIHWEVGAHADGILNWQARGPGMVSACCSRWPSPWPITGADFSGLGRFDFIVGRRTWTSDVGLRSHPGWRVLPRPSLVPHYLVHGSYAHLYLKIPSAQMSEKKRENIKVKDLCSGVNFASGFSETIALLSHVSYTHIGPRAAKTNHIYIYIWLQFLWGVMNYNLILYLCA